MSFYEWEKREDELTPEETPQEAYRPPVPENGPEPVYDPDPEPAAKPEPRPAPPVQPYNFDNDRHTMWSEPVYESASADSVEMYNPGHYAYGAQVNRAAAEPPKKKKKHGFLKAVCLVLVCVLLSGTASYFVVDYALRRYEPPTPGTQVVIGSTIGTGESSVQRPASTGGGLTASDIYYDLAVNQVVGVNTSLTTNVFGQTSTQAVSGSGFIISADGYILTNYHVISYAVVYGGELTVLMHDGTSYPATIKGYVESNDVAVIKIEAEGLSPVALGDSDGMLVGESVYAVGNPLGELEYTITPGIVSALDRVVTTADDITGDTTSINMFQISAAVNSGNSGGPVYNARGEVIGIVTAKYADSGIEGLGFAIPINDAIGLATQLIEYGYVASAGLGIQGIDADKFHSAFAMEYYGYPDGVAVVEVTEDSAAEAAGIHAGDIITAVGSRSVASMNELQIALRRYSPGDTETITVFRPDQSLGHGESIELTITFGELVPETVEEETQQRPSNGWGGWGGWNWGW